MKKLFCFLSLIITSCGNPETNPDKKPEELQLPAKKIEVVNSQEKEKEVVNSYSNSEIQNENEKLVQQLIDMGEIKIDLDLYHVYIKPLTWVQIDAMQKAAFAKQMLDYLKRHTNDKYNSVDIYDLQSGKKLADYDPMFGFDVE